MIACEALPSCSERMPRHTTSRLCLAEHHHKSVLQVLGPSRLQSGTPEPRADIHRPRRPTPGAVEVSSWRISGKFSGPMQLEMQRLSCACGSLVF